MTVQFFSLESDSSQNIGSIDDLRVQIRVDAFFHFLSHKTDGNFLSECSRAQMHWQRSIRYAYLMSGNSYEIGHMISAISSHSSTYYWKIFIFIVTCLVTYCCGMQCPPTAAAWRRRWERRSINMHLRGTTQTSSDSCGDNESAKSLIPHCMPRKTCQNRTKRFRRNQRKKKNQKPCAHISTCSCS